MSAFHVALPTIALLVWFSVAAFPVQLTHVTSLGFTIALCVVSSLHGIFTDRAMERHNQLVVIYWGDNNHFPVVQNGYVLVVVN